MNIKHRRDLWRLLRGLEGDLAEIGVAEGRYSREILNWPIEVPTLYLVDRWRHVHNVRGDSGNSQEWHEKNLETVRDIARKDKRVVILNGDSAFMANGVPSASIIFCYIDADHSYTGVTNDINAWYPKMKSGGVMAFHDYLNPNYGVKKAVDEFCAAAKYTPIIIPENNPLDASAYFIC